MHIFNVDKTENRLINSDYKLKVSLGNVVLIYNEGIFNIKGIFLCFNINTN